MKKKIIACLKILILIIAFVLICYFINKRMNTLSELSKKCDFKKNYTCSYYELQEYRSNK